MSFLDKISEAFVMKKDLSVAAPTIADIKAAQQLVQSSTRLMENAVERNRKANDILVNLVERSNAA